MDKCGELCWLTSCSKAFLCLCHVPCLKRPAPGALQQMVTSFEGMALDHSNLPDVYIEFDNGGSQCAMSMPGIQDADWSNMKALTLEPGEAQAG
jgi:hypothetical protein